MSNQKPRTIEEQICLLRSRGMTFSNEEEAKQCLAHISYFRLKVTNSKGHRDKWLQNPLTDNQKKKPYGVISAMLYLCNAVYPDNQIKDKLLALIDNCPNIPYYKYGFVGDWRKEPIWR